MVGLALKKPAAHSRSGLAVGLQSASSHEALILPTHPLYHVPGENTKATAPAYVQTSHRAFSTATGPAPAEDLMELHNHYVLLRILILIRGGLGRRLTR